MLKKGFELFVVLLVLLSAMGCATPAPEVALEGELETKEELARDLTHQEVADLHASDSIVVLDVREPFEHERGVIPGALELPLGDLPQRIDEVPMDRPVVLVCRSGNRSDQARHYLESEGFENVHNMLGGMNAWQAAGYEVDRD
jgi:rhodanese-related sulfurtransferase